MKPACCKYDRMMHNESVKARLAELQHKMGQTKSMIERLDIASEITVLLAQMLAEQTRSMRPAIISPMVGRNWYLALMQDADGRSAGYTLVSREVLKELGTTADMEPFIWMVEALDGRN